MTQEVVQAIKVAKSKALKILGSVAFLRKQVDVRKVAEQLGIAVKELPLQADLSGIIKINSNLGMPIIVVNETHPLTRQRFTIAHEIGHYLLHKNENVHIDGAVFFRDAESTTGNKLKEIQANQFAAELLMPSFDLVRRYCGLMASKENDTDESDNVFPEVVQELADFYGVSKQAVTIKLGSSLT